MLNVSLTHRSVLKRALFAACTFLTAATLAWSAPAEDKHDHPEKGPHGGALVELGDEEYHVEVVVDEKTETLTLYVLDSKAKAAVPTDAKEAIVSLKHGGKPEQFKIPAARLKTDPAGLASSFQIKNEELIHDLHEKKADPRLSIKVKGKSYSAKLELKHDHDHKD